MTGLFVADPGVEVDPDDIPGIRHERVLRHLQTFPSNQRTAIDFLMQVFVGNTGQQFREVEFLCSNRFDDNTAGFLANVHRLIERQLGGLHHGRWDANRGTVFPHFFTKTCTFHQNLHLRPLDLQCRYWHSCSGLLDDEGRGEYRASASSMEFG
jgi:hypothetical protein